ncbi:energy transducer TonB [Sphingomonas sp. NSE70-1]|uniref:Energy transducer TonB n=1 Tax=Sphingomonas caseinilyticus TaxID=2908205 RepID=A0ABT0RXL0_9SPHN|nr:energy transducer TonB [Sphingomonas caseinilyticus]MCL6699753.1 energy transducer TonB [Sphingomonas caseinilyticus]
MPGYSADPTRPDKAKAIAAVALVYAMIIGAALLMPSDSPLGVRESDPTVLIDVKEIPEPQPPPPEEPGKAELEEGAAGKKAEPTPVVAPKPAIELPAKPPVVAAPVAGTGNAATAGAAQTGAGPGAGGSGTGRGGGGSGGGGGIGSEARLLGGNSSKLPARLLRAFSADRGYGYLMLTVGESGRVTDCGVLQSTGNDAVDQALCNLMIRQSRWQPARDRQGNAISVKVRYTATWSKN